jgi:uncharacterized protein YigA (DUF484 family)
LLAVGDDPDAHLDDLAKANKRIQDRVRRRQEAATKAHVMDALAKEITAGLQEK